jgi:hypothetical protein
VRARLVGGIRKPGIYGTTRSQRIREGARLVRPRIWSAADRQRLVLWGRRCARKRLARAVEWRSLVGVSPDANHRGEPGTRGVGVRRVRRRKRCGALRRLPGLLPADRRDVRQRNRALERVVMVDAGTGIEFRGPGARSVRRRLRTGALRRGQLHGRRIDDPESHRPLERRELVRRRRRSFGRRGPRDSRASRLGDGAGRGPLCDGLFHDRRRRLRAEHRTLDRHVLDRSGLGSSGRRSRRGALRRRERPHALRHRRLPDPGLERLGLARSRLRGSCQWLRPRGLRRRCRTRAVCVRKHAD